VRLKHATGWRSYPVYGSIPVTSASLTEERDMLCRLARDEDDSTIDHLLRRQLVSEQAINGFLTVASPKIGTLERAGRKDAGAREK
jgi:hypothetical protein